MLGPSDSGRGLEDPLPSKDVVLRRFRMVAQTRSSARFQFPYRPHPFLNRSGERVEFAVLHNQHALQV